MKKYYLGSKRRRFSYRVREERLTELATSCVETAF